MTQRGWALFVAMGLIWGVPYLMIRVAVTDFDPAFVAFGRTLIGALLLIPIALYRDALRPVFARWKWLLVYTLIEITGPWLLLGHAETKLNSSLTGLLVAATPLVAAVIATRLGHERFDTRRVVGLLIGMVGVVALVGLDLQVDDMLSVVFVGLVAVGYALGPIVINRKLADLPPIGVVTGSLIVAAAIYLPYAVFKIPSEWPADASLSVVGLGVLCTAIAFVVFFALIAEVGPARATVITYLNPAVAIVLGIAILSEPFTIGIAIGFPLVILGSVLGTAKTRRGTDRADVPAADAPLS